MTQPVTRLTAVLATVFAATSAANAGEPFFDRADLSEADTGGYAHYRIPGLVVTRTGTLLAHCEARKSTTSDRGPVDILLSRTTDVGKTWAPPRKVVRPPDGVTKDPVALAQKLGKPGEITVNNPAAVVDQRTGAVHLLSGGTGDAPWAGRLFDRRGGDGPGQDPPEAAVSGGS